MKILVINGPNLNMLGKRDPAVYGKDTLADIQAEISALAARDGIETEWYQSDVEGEIVGRLHAFDADGLVINAGAYSHYSIAIRDALELIGAPKFEVHISNIYAREEFRHHSVLSAVCNGVIAGFGKRGYLCAIKAAARG